MIFQLVFNTYWYEYRYSIFQVNSLSNTIAMTL